MNDPKSYIFALAGKKDHTLKSLPEQESSEQRINNLWRYVEGLKQEIEELKKALKEKNNE